MITKHIFLLAITTCCTCLSVTAQEYFRFKADFSIKEKIVGEEKGKLITGTVYYDANTRKVIHEITFPERETWINHDTLMYRIIKDSLVSKTVTGQIGEFSMYNMILSQQLNDFGLGQGGYTLAKVEESTEGKTTSTWEPIQQLKELLGKIILIQENKRVSAVAMFSVENLLRSKFYFQDYQIIEDLPVPGKIYQIAYLPDNKEFNRITTYKNIIINQDAENEKYDYRIPPAQH